MAEILSHLICDVVISEHGLRGIHQDTLRLSKLIFVRVDLRVDHRVSELVGVVRTSGHVRGSWQAAPRPAKAHRCATHLALPISHDIVLYLQLLEDVALFVEHVLLLVLCILALEEHFWFSPKS